MQRSPGTLVRLFSESGRNFVRTGKITTYRPKLEKGTDQGNFPDLYPFWCPGSAFCFLEELATYPEKVGAELFFALDPSVPHQDSAVHDGGLHE